MQPPRSSRSFEAAVGVAGYAALMAALSLIALGIGLRRFGADRKLGQRLASSPKG